MLSNPQLPPLRPSFFQLSARLKAAREYLRRMERGHKIFLGFAFVSALTVVGLAFFLGRGGDGFSKLLIDPAYAQDNFTVTATLSDSLGVESTTAFDIRSKTSLDAGLLKESIALVPAAEFELKATDDKNFQLRPKEPLLGKRVYNVRIVSAFVTSTGKEERNYSWAFQVKDQFKVLQTLPRDEATGVPLDTGIELTFTADNFTDYDKAFAISPETAGQFEKHGRTLVFVPQNPLVAGTLYTVTVSKDLLALSGSDKRLESDYAFRFETDSNGAVRGSQSEFDFEKNFNEFSTKDAPTFGVWAYGLAAGDMPAEVFAFKSEQQFADALKVRAAVPYWASYSRATYLCDTNDLAAAGSYKLSISKYSYQEYITLPSALPRGYYLIQIHAGGLVRQAYFQVTDLAVYASATETDTLVWANDLRTGAPGAGLSVASLDGGEQAKTGTDGTVRVPTDKLFGLNQEDYKDAFLKVGSGDFSSIVPLGINYQGQGAAAADGYWYHFYTDRSLYKTDDTVRFWGFLKARQGGDAAGQVTVRLTKGDYYDYYYDPVVISETAAGIEHNALSGELKLEHLTPGYYYLEFSYQGKTIGTQYLSVQTYSKPAYSLELKPRKDAVFAGENIVLDAEAKFFEGTPVAQLGLTYRHDQDTPVDIKTDQDGRATITIPTSYSDCSQADYCYYPGYSGISLWPTGAENGEITADTQVRIFGAGVKASTSFEQEGADKAKISVTVNQVDLDQYNRTGDTYLGAAAPNIALHGELTRYDYNKTEGGTYYDFINKVARKQYTYTQVRVPLGTFEGRTDASGKFIYELPISLENSYEVKVSVDDGAGRKDMVKDWLWTRQGGEDRYENYNLWFTDPSKRESATFVPGEEVKLEFKNNETLLSGGGAPHFLYYRLQDGLLGYDISADARYSFAFEDKFIPNIYVTGVWFDGLSYHQSGASSWYGGGTLVSFDPAERSLELELKTDKDSYQPGEEVTLDVSVKDKDGQPAETDLNLNLVDEAFYALNPESVDTLRSLYGPTMSSGELSTYGSHSLPLGTRGGAERGGCFVAGTQVTMADGTYENIEDVKVGDRVLTFQDETVRGKASARVAAVYRHKVGEYLIINGKLKVTPEHRVFVNNGWEPIGMAKVGDYLVDERGQRVRIDRIERQEGMVEVYNLGIEGYHTYFAGGIWVHNDKGGGRENFVDTALFTSVRTNRDGKTQVKFKLPDNLTSWRVTAQGISDALEAGSNTYKIPVSLPVFATVAAAGEYLTSDQPVIKINSYGQALQTGSAVDYRLSAQTLGVDFSAAGQAFTAQYVPLPNLTSGTHKLTVAVKAGDAEDKLIQPVTVLGSRLTARKQGFYALALGLKPEGNAIGRTTLVFTDKNRGQFYQELAALEWTGGDRVDQKLSRVVASELSRQYFGQDGDYVESFDGNVYQLPGGGIALLPYGDEDLALSAKLAAVAPSHFDTDALKDYFFRVYNGPKATSEEVGLALFGLSTLGEPVLIPLQHFAALPDLSPEARIYAALSLLSLGDREAARTVYLDLMNKYAEHLEPYVRIKAGDDQVLMDTALMAVLAGGVGDAYRDQLWKYARESEEKDLLTNTEKLMYITATMPNLMPGQVSFTVATGSRTENVALNEGRSFKLSVTAEELRNLSFSDIKGEVGVTSIWEAPSADRIDSPYVSVRREYRTDGQKTDAFKENSLVEVVLNPNIKEEAPGEDYQLTDYLPSGLKIVTNPYSRDRGYDPCVGYPFEIDGQKVKFYLNKSWYKSTSCGSTLKYYARVISTGSYAAEPATVESLSASAVRSYSAAGRISITR